MANGRKRLTSLAKTDKLAEKTICGEWQIKQITALQATCSGN